jgi:hypothetical protein
VKLFRRLAHLSKYFMIPFRLDYFCQYFHFFLEADELLLMPICRNFQEKSFRVLSKPDSLNYQNLY